MYQREYKKLRQKTKNKISCPTCSRGINAREIHISSVLVKPLAKVYMWCRQNDKWSFRRKDIEHIIGKSSTNVGSNWHNWRFTGLIEQPGKKGYYEMSRPRCEMFLRNELAVPHKILAWWLLTFNDEDHIIRAERRYDPVKGSELTMRNFPRMSKYLDQELDYVVQYVK